MENKETMGYKNKLNYIMKYSKSNYKRILLQFRTESNGDDAKILKYLDRQPSKNAYVKGLIVADMKNKGEL